VALLLFVALAIGNFLWLVTDRPAGSALSGSQQGGHFVLASHSESVEVDRATWERRAVQEVLLLVSFPVVFLVVKFGSSRRR
jgi:hypothetical protein